MTVVNLVYLHTWPEAGSGYHGSVQQNSALNTLPDELPINKEAGSAIAEQNSSVDTVLPFSGAIAPSWSAYLGIEVDVAIEIAEKIDI